MGGQRDWSGPGARIYAGGGGGRQAKVRGKESTQSPSGKNRGLERDYGVLPGLGSGVEIVRGSPAKYGRCMVQICLVGDVGAFVICGGVVVEGVDGGEKNGGG